MKREKLLAGIQRLVAIETAPYSELFVRSALHKWLEELGLGYDVDASGNTLVRVRRGMPRRQVGFVAHLDHPAMRVDSVSGGRITCRAEGGLPTIGARNAKVVFPRTRHGRINGRIESAKVIKHDGRARLERVVIQVNAKGPKPEVDDFAVLDLPAMARKGHRLKLRVADDLAGVTAIVAALADLAKGVAPVDAWGMFTRAEEVGFHGALALAIDGRLPRDMTIVSVECSRAIEPITIGAGPVVRLGDRGGPFDPRACALLMGSARALNEGRSKFDYQSGMMPGGTCEATAFTAFGYLAAGIALPLANYHNQGPRAVAAEEIDVRDLEGAVTLIQTAALRGGAGIEEIDLLRNELVRSSEDGREKLRRPIDMATGVPIASRF